MPARAGPAHDAAVTGALHPLGSDVVKACLPRGQAKPFPANCLSLMTVSGAKGSGVNFSQISALLGQQARHTQSRLCLWRPWVAGWCAWPFRAGKPSHSGLCG